MCVFPVMRALSGFFTDIRLSSARDLVTVKEDCEAFSISDQVLIDLMNDINEAIKNGLKRETRDTSTIKCLITNVQELPRQRECGTYMALEMNHNEFKVLYFEFDEVRDSRREVDTYEFPDHLKTGNGTDLFDYVAKCLADFLKLRNIKNFFPLPLGFTFCFPLQQDGLSIGYLNKWTKGLNCSGVVNEDVANLLQEAIDRRNDVNIDVSGVLNDTTGILMACALKKENTKIGLIVGEGCNACYLEKVDNVELFEGNKLKPYVVINTEWGAFGDDGKLDTLRTKYDVEIDESSLNPGLQRYEKMTSGMYLGEIVRLTIVDLASQNRLFKGKLSKEMKTKGAFLTKYIALVDTEENAYKETINILKNLNIKNPSLVDCANVKYICQCVAIRAARLVSAGLAAILNKMNDESVAIGVHGMVINNIETFLITMDKSLKQLVHPNINYDILSAKDGSGRGAAHYASEAEMQTLFRAHHNSSF